MSRRDFVRSIEKIAYGLAADADAETNLRVEHEIDAQCIADLAQECIDELRALIGDAVSQGVIGQPVTLMASARRL